MTKTKEQLEEEKKISLSIRIKPLDVDAMDSDQLQSKAKELWETIVRLETEKYDLTERQKRQDYDLKELKERQKQQLRQKAMKKGLDPEALTGKYPPKIRMYSKYERRTDTRTYEDRRKLYEGGWEVVRSEHLQASWKEKYDEWLKRPKSKLPKWFGERPGKKSGDPESPEGEEEKYDEATADPSADLPWAHNGEPAPQEIRDLAAAGTPFFSTFAGVRLEGAKLRRMRFMSRLQLAGRSPGHIFVSCQDCKAKRTIEDPQDLLRVDKGNLTGKAAVAICPTCCVLITE